MSDGLQVVSLERNGNTNLPQLATDAEDAKGKYLNVTLNDKEYAELRRSNPEFYAPQVAHGTVNFAAGNGYPTTRGFQRPWWKRKRWLALLALALVAIVVAIVVPVVLKSRQSNADTNSTIELQDRNQTTPKPDASITNRPKPIPTKEPMLGMRPGSALAAGAWVSNPEHKYGADMTMRLLFQDTTDRIRFLSSNVTAGRQTPWKIDEDASLPLRAAPDLLFRLYYHRKSDLGGICLSEWIRTVPFQGEDGVLSKMCIQSHDQLAVGSLPVTVFYADDSNNLNYIRHPVHAGGWEMPRRVAGAAMSKSSGVSIGLNYKNGTIWSLFYQQPDAEGMLVERLYHNTEDKWSGSVAENYLQEVGQIPRGKKVTVLSVPPGDTSVPDQTVDNYLLFQTEEGPISMYIRSSSTLLMRPWEGPITPRLKVFHSARRAGTNIVCTHPHRAATGIKDAWGELDSAPEVVRCFFERDEEEGGGIAEVGLREGVWEEVGIIQPSELLKEDLA